MFNAIFRIPAARKIAMRHLEDAERHALEHEAAAEHHDALATMYRGRVERLRAYLASGQAAAQLVAVETESNPKESSK